MSSLKYTRSRTNLTHAHTQTQAKLQEIGRIMQLKMQERFPHNWVGLLPPLPPHQKKKGIRKGLVTPGRIYKEHRQALTLGSSPD